VCVPGQPPASPASAGEAMELARAGLGWLAGADVASLQTGTQAGLLRDLERAESSLTAARARVLGAFAAQAGFEDDGQGSARSWLRWQARTTTGAAAGAMGWMRRLAAHRAVAEALADGDVSASWAREICAWTDRLPEDRRADADQILLGAAAGGADLAGLSGLAEEMFRRSAPPDSDDEDDGGFGDRSLQLDLHFRGAGKLGGDLTPECAAALTAVLESLGKKAGPEDDRSKAQRDHDALEEACRRLVAAGGLPDVAGQPTQIQLHMTLDQLRSLDGAADAEAAWAAGRATGDGDPGWVQDPAAAEGYACDAKITPIVSGHVDPAALARMTAAWLNSTDPDRAAGDPAGGGSPGAGGGPSGTGRSGPPALPPKTMRRLQDTLLRYAADVLSGPAGLAAFLRTGLLAADFPPAMSLTLDTGAPTSVIPPNLRRAVISRDRHCAFPGCEQRPAACQVHHLIPRSKGGITALTNLALVCPFHHLVAIHRWGWTLALNGDATSTATSPDRTRILHSHGRPVTAAA
jgi:hypothetical protein